MIFRYPGGKKKLAEQIGTHLDPIIENEFHDVFVGGGSILCYVAKKYPSILLYANDLDENIYSFWKMISNKQSDMSYFYRLLKQKPTIKLFRKIKLEEPITIEEKAYYSVFFNRTTFSGIYNSGPIGGMLQKSKWTIDCRYNYESMYKQCEEMRIFFNGRLTVKNLDFSQYLKKIEDVCCYIDPPYYQKGRELYKHYMTDDQHLDLANILKKRTKWVLSYDNCPFIETQYNRLRVVGLSARYSISGKKKNWANKKELLILGSAVKVNQNIEYINQSENKLFFKEIK